MEITEVKVFPVSEEKLKAFVSIVLDGCFMVNDIKVIRGKDGLFISMPSRKKKSGEFKDVAHPLNNETRQLIEDSVLDEYERILRERGQEPEVGRRQLSVEEEEAGFARSRQVQAAPARVPETGVPESRPQAAAPPVPEPASEPGTQTAPAAEAAAEPTGNGTASDQETEEPKEKSLEEIQEMHLRDSFWSVS